MIQQSKYFSPYGSNSYILWNINRHQILYLCIHPQLLKTCCIVHQFEISSVQVVYSRAVCFMPVVLLTTFGACLAFAEGCAWWELPSVLRLGAGLALWVLYGHAGRESFGQILGPRGFHSPYARDSSTLCAARPLSLKISGLCQTFRNQAEPAVVTSGMTQMGSVVELSN